MNKRDDMARLASLAAVALAGMFIAAPAYAQAEGDSKQTEASSAAGQAKKEKIVDRVKSVQNKVFLKKGRFELEPSFGFGLNSAFNQEYAPILTMDYHIVEQFAVRLDGAYYINASTSNASFMAKDALAVPDNGKQVFNLFASAEWAPLYGKFSLFGAIIHFDFYITGGIGTTDVRYTGYNWDNLKNVAREANMNGFKFAGVVGAGERFFITDWLAIRLEIRDEIYSMTLQPKNYTVNYQVAEGATDQTGNTCTTAGGCAWKQIGAYTQIQNHVMFTIGLSFFFPTSFTQE